MTTGENSGTWGNVTNVNLGTALEEAIVGSADVTFSSGTVTLTLTDSNSTQTARNLRLNLTGTSGGAQNLIVPAIEKIYLVNNGCADAITVKNSSGTGIAVPAGKTMWVYNNGTNVVDAVTHLTSLTLASALPIASGGTGTNATTFANLQSNVSGVLPIGNGGTGTNATTGTGSVVYSASPTLTGIPAAPTAANGTNTTQIATTAFVGSAVTAATGSLGTMSSQNSNAVSITGGTIAGITDLAVADGGTGASSITANSVVLGNGSSALSGNLVAPGTSGNVLISNGVTWISSVNQSVGTGQTWQRPSRSLSTNYINGTGRPIQVHVVMQADGGGGGSTTSAIVDGLTISSGGTNSVSGGLSCVTHSFIVPENATYSVTAGGMSSLTISTWAELR